MSFAHNDLMTELGFMLRRQLDRERFIVRVNAGRVRLADETYYIPDVLVIPRAAADPVRSEPGVLETYDVPLPLVVEVWSPSTGGYDVDRKIPEYRRRGDLEIWRIHPFEKRLKMWRRRPDGTYAESALNGGLVAPSALPGVIVDLDELFALT